MSPETTKAMALRRAAWPDGRWEAEVNKTTYPPWLRITDERIRFDEEWKCDE